ncbi:MAG: ATP-grasp domain-containing protein [Butyrivibrio sp.]|nr:ATP-grasp domain-containing protein [Butyrivibrio sp.]
MDKKKVLIFPAGAENALEIFDSLRYNVNVELYGASGKKDYAEYCYDAEHYIEGDFYITNSGFINYFNEILLDKKIDVVIPTHDDIALYLAKVRDKLASKILVSDEKTADICRHKKLTYELIKDEFFCPKIIRNRDEVNEEAFPLFAKPDAAAGGQGTKLIKKEADLEDSFFGANYILSEFLPGEELTVDCFTGRSGELKFAGARTRDRIVNGIASRSTVIEMPDDVGKIANILNDKLNFFGAWYFQVKKDKDNKYKLLEVACRQAGTMTLYRHMGINFPMLGIFELYGIDTSYVLHKCKAQLERRISTKFRTDIEYDTVYMDYDDTIVVAGKVCKTILIFLYECIEEGKKIVLLSRHDGDLDDEFEKFRLNKKIFDEIIHITFDEDKIDFINPERAIFIDNSYAERKKVNDKFGIPVFDVDNVDMLIKS